jgi:N-carbamoylputrescine amidase
VAAPAHLAGAPRALTVAAIQLACGWDLEDNLVRAERHVRDAARLGARVILLPELFATPYFCIEQDARHLSLARAPQDCEAVQRMRTVARELEVVLPVSFFERAGAAYFNSVAVIDADGGILGVYRKSHIPDGPGYQEKYYFSPGDTGFAVWPTRFARLGVGICWDQWFPECARAMALGGAQLLLYPTAIGSEPPPAPPVDSREHWMRVQQGHAAANLVPLVAANRCGTEHSLADPERLKLRFHGSSFMTDETGAILARAPEEGDAVISATFDLAAIAARRDGWGVFRDRRPDLYGALLTLEGRVPVREPSAPAAVGTGGGGGNRTPVRKR